MPHCSYLAERMKGIEALEEWNRNGIVGSRTPKFIFSSIESAENCFKIEYEFQLSILEVAPSNSSQKNN